MNVVFDDRACELGEGPLWHPEREQLFWFDIIAKQLMTVEDGQAKNWSFDEHVSAAGWVDRNTLLMAAETGLWRFDIQTGARELVVPLEADNDVTRSNDGRADPWGGFWIGTMGKRAEPKAGAIYRFFKGELRQLVPDVSISNAICFAPDRSAAFYTDTVTGKIMRQPLARDTGWPEGDAGVFVDLRPERLNPDGAVVDASGVLWVAQWGAGRVAAYGADGQFLRAVDVPGTHATCPAFGGDNLDTLFCTSARQGLSQEALKQEPRNGMTFAVLGIAKGQAEHRVLL